MEQRRGATTCDDATRCASAMTACNWTDTTARVASPLRDRTCSWEKYDREDAESKSDTLKTCARARCDIDSALFLRSSGSRLILRATREAFNASESFRTRGRHVGDTRQPSSSISRYYAEIRDSSSLSANDADGRAYGELIGKKSAAQFSAIRNFLCNFPIDKIVAAHKWVNP